VHSFESVREATEIRSELEPWNVGQGRVIDRGFGAGVEREVAQAIDEGVPVVAEGVREVESACEHREKLGAVTNWK
jgi:hypothetical protein